jgi:beta-phosphoglucomutase-like phosphatase (HAD superfamily)
MPRHPSAPCRDGVTVTAEDFDAVLFDMDGALTTTAPLHEVAWRSTFDTFLDEWDASGTGSSSRPGPAFAVTAWPVDRAERVPDPDPESPHRTADGSLTMPNPIHAVPGG